MRRGGLRHTRKCVLVSVVALLVKQIGPPYILHLSVSLTPTHPHLAVQYQMCIITQLPHALLLATTLRQSAPTSLRKWVFERADVSCVMHQSRLCGQSRLLHPQLLLTQHCLALAASTSLLCGSSRGSGRSLESKSGIADCLFATRDFSIRGT